MAKKWSEIVKKQIPIEKLSLQNIYDGNFDSDALDSVKKKTQANSGKVLTDKLRDFDTLARTGEQKKPAETDDTLPLSS